MTMKAATLTLATLMLVALSYSSAAVQVEENGLTFSLEGVKRLQQMTESWAQVNPRFRSSGGGSLCAEPMLPQEFLPLCKQRGGASSLARLAMVPLDVCEICAFAACTGC